MNISFKGIIGIFLAIPLSTWARNTSPELKIHLASDVIQVYDHSDPRVNCGEPWFFPDAIGVMKDPQSGDAILIMAGPGWNDASYQIAPGETFHPHNAILTGVDFDHLERPCQDGPRYPRFMASGPGTDRFGDYYSLLWWGGKGHYDAERQRFNWIVYNETHGDFYTGTGLPKPPGGDNDEEIVSIRFQSDQDGLPGSWYLVDEQGKPTGPRDSAAPHLVAQFGQGLMAPTYAPLVEEWTYTTSASHVNNELIQGPDGHFYVLTDFGAVSNLGHTTFYPGWNQQWMPPHNGHVFCMGRTVGPNPYDKVLYMDEDGNFTIDYSRDPYREPDGVLPRWCQPADFFPEHTQLGITPLYRGSINKASITYNHLAQKYLAIGWSRAHDIECLKAVVQGNYSHPAVIKWGPRFCHKPGFYYSLSDDLVKWTQARHVDHSEIFDDQQQGSILVQSPDLAGQESNIYAFNYGVSLDPDSTDPDLSESGTQLYYFFENIKMDEAQSGDEVCPVFQSGNMWGGGHKNHGSYTLYSNTSNTPFHRPTCMRRIVSMIKFKIDLESR